ncbi:hypothetical protein ZYGM_002016 [Zygosaccharomyces mellis]|uniref:Uncharacterized protein n=1 Tax=Zygosaccharomyces mellis TaxID=42258 RepID=A0A4C2E2J0_9SACH|nr:hypothetical protein ZYGM_002016 [Zygosaccharomyces mellis]
MQEGSKREEDTSKKIGFSNVQQSEGDASNNLIKVRIKRQILKDLGFLEGESHEVEDELIASDKSLDLYLQIRLEKERRQIESLRESNLDRLNTIIDKCVQSDKFTKDSLWKILDLTNKPLPSSSSGDGGSQQPSQQPSHQRPAHPTVALSPDARKRKLASPTVSPKGHKRFASDVPSLSSVAATHSPYYGTTIQSGPSPWASQQYNQPQQQQFEFRNSLPAGLGGSARHSHQESIQTTPVGENQVPTATMSQQQFFAGRYSPAQFVSGGAPSGYFLPAATATAATAAAQGGRSHPVVMMQPDSPPPQRVPTAYLQPPQHVPSSYGSTIKQEHPAITRRFQGHRRSQSANVPTVGTSFNPMRSPARDLHATPQKSINFLIHTPRHPPPG